MKHVILLILLAFYIQVAFCVSASDIVNEARSHVGETRWSYSSSYGTGIDTNKCNQFVYDVLDNVGADPPERYAWWVPGDYPIGAGEWGNQRSSYLIDSNCWNPCSGQWSSGDVISDAVHVAIVTGYRRTTSAAHDRVVENDWGYRNSGSGSTHTLTACWRYTC